MHARRPSHGSTAGSGSQNGRRKQAAVQGKKGAQKFAGPAMVSVNLLTGQEEKLVFWDPSLCVSQAKPGTADHFKDPTYVAKWLFSPASVTRILDTGDALVKTPDGEAHRMQASKLVRVVAQDTLGMPDILQLNNFSEASLLHTLRVRYSRDEVYSLVGPILISINPYKWIHGLYDEGVMLRHHGGKEAGSAEPHLFSVAEAAYAALLSSGGGKPANQSIIISGESGAGKTEATKLVMQYLARVQRQAGNVSSNGTASQHHKLEDRVLSCNPLLESFGNARTLRNDNSSRFGKFIQIQFGSSGRIVGARIENYLLEKTRIVQQSAGERNYHVFYQLLEAVGRTDEGEGLLGGLGLHGNAAYSYLCGGSGMHIPGRSDGSDYDTTIACLQALEIPRETQRGIFEILAAILHLGNVTFDAGESGSEGGRNTKVSPGSEETLTLVSKLLGVPRAGLEAALCTKQLVVGGNTVVQHQTAEQASDKKDALAKGTYSQLFLWLVQVINDSISNNDSSWGFIGVLDIYGFEQFETNSFEQLLINYANEALQRHFNRHVFEVEQEDYGSEGIDWSYIKFNDNQPCLDLIDGKPDGRPGVLVALDDSQRFQGSEADLKFLAQLTANHGPKSENGTHAHFVIPRFGADQYFGIAHYAGEVLYDITGFNAKNADELSRDIKDLISASSAPLLHELCAALGSTLSPEPVQALPGPSKHIRQRSRGRIRETSVSSQFRTSLAGLVAILSATSPRYIRCIKPNHEKAPSSLNATETLRQLRYAGMMETIRIRHQGYALRETHDSFYRRYSVLVPTVGSVVDMVESLSQLLHVSKEDWQIGHTKVFLRASLADSLERLVTLRVRSAARTAQRAWRHFCLVKMAIRAQACARRALCTRRYRQTCRACLRIQTWFRSRKEVVSWTRKRASVIRSQAVCRGYLAKRIVRDLRDPYLKLSPSQLGAALADAEKELSYALEAKEFARCAELQERLGAIQRALRDRGLAGQDPLRVEGEGTSRDGMSRDELDIRMLETRLRLDAAAAAKEFVLCGQLQEALQALEVLMEQYQTPEEARGRAIKARADLESAIARKDFRMAAELDGKVQHLDARAAAIEAEASLNQPPSRVDLEARSAAAASSLEQAQAGRNFALCAELQEQLDAIKAQLEALPTAESLAATLEAAEHELDQAKLSSDFRRIAEATVALPKLRAQLDIAEKQGASLPLSRKELLAREEALKADLDVLMSQKAFDKCDGVQKQLDRVLAAIAKLPTAEQLDAEITQVKSELDTALKAKNFAVCADLEKRLQSLLADRSFLPPPPQAASAPRANAGPVTTPVKAKIAHPGVSAAPRTALSAKKVPVAVCKTPQTKSVVSSMADRSTKKDARPVSKLRPKKPLTMASSSSIIDVAMAMSKERGDAALLVDSRGALLGIVTDNDLTRRVVAKGVDVLHAVSTIMTASPTCVTMEDSAIGALGIMVERHFRHLPVTDSSGAVAGLLDIAKCLYEAISRMERVASNRAADENDSGAAAAAALQQMTKAMASNRKGGANAAQAVAMMQLMSQAFGSQGAKTLADVLTAAGEAIFVSPSDTVRDASEAMASGRKAVLVVERGALVGIFTPKDVLNRVIAKGLPPEETIVADVMTPNPDSVGPDLTVLDALHQMHECRYLHLPVVDDRGRVQGLVDVMEIINAMIGEEGSSAWGNFFGDAMDAGDDFSDTGSMRSLGSLAHGSVRSAARSVAKPVKNNKPPKDARPVSKLRPKMPVLQSSGASIFEVAEAMAAARTDAALLVGPDGSLMGIVTDNDMTRRVVAKGVSAQDEVMTIMTANPKCVTMEDSAMEALGVMVERHFRHLPVTDSTGSVAGLLDIARCLYEAISRMEKVASKRAAGDEGGSVAAEALKQMTKAMASNRKGGANAAQAAAMMQLMSQAFGSQGATTLSDVLVAAGEALFVSPSDTVRDASEAMASGRKAVLVVERGALVGIFTPKDVLNRVLAKGLSPEETIVADVMTPNPDSVGPDLTVLDALHQMHECRYLHLPVVDDRGRVQGLVDVMEIINAMIGEEGSSGWEAFFGDAMDAGDDFSDTGSMRSLGSLAHGSVRPSKPSKGRATVKDARPVSKLRPKMPVVQNSSASIFQVAESMALAHTDAALLVGADGSLVGIVTDNDITRRVVAKGVNPQEAVIAVMTANPKCVTMEDSAMEALGVMVERHFRHLPVTDRSGSVAGLLDIARCLYEAISRMEKVASKKAAGNDSGSAATEALKQMTKAMASSRKGGANAAQAAAMMQLMTQAFGSQGATTLSDVLVAAGEALFVSPSDTVRDASEAMASGRKAVLVVERGALVGIFTPKDVLNRVVAKGLSPEETVVADVMTPNPDSVGPDLTVLDALHQMHECRYLHLPVVDDRGRVQGLVDVMEIINAMIGEEGSSGWEAFFGDAMDAGDDFSETGSMHSLGSLAHGSVRSAARSTARTAKSRATVKDARPVSKLRPKMPVVQSSTASIFEVANAMAAARTDASLVVGPDGSLMGIVTDNDLTRRVIAKGVNVQDEVSTVMTANPKCVTMEDSAMEALGVMVERHFRHLPVTDRSGSVAGLLDIAKCLYEAISRMEKVASKKAAGNDGAAATEALKQMTKAMASSRKGGANAAAMMQLMAQAFGSQGATTLSDVLVAAGEALFVSPSDTVRDASEAMASGRKAVLVVERGALVGIFTPKDVLNRVLAKGLSPEETAVADVMTPNPDSVGPDLTVLDALHQMHECRYLHLPVVDDRGRVQGLVDVMEIINAMIGEEGSSGWEAFFGDAMDAGDDFSDTGSMHSLGSLAHGSVRSAARSTARTAKSRATVKDARPVSKLRPKMPVVQSSTASIFEVADAMAAARTDASLVVGPDGSLMGIVTDNDLTRRVIAKGVNVQDEVSTVMTANPKCVTMEDSAMEALGVMVERHFRHLPVTDRSGSVAGLLDIAKCLYEAISRMEKVASKKAAGNDGAAATEALKQMTKAMASSRKGGANAAAMMQLMTQAFGSQGATTLSDVLVAAGEALFVSPSDTVRDASEAMASGRKAVLVVERGALVGIFTPKDALNRVLAKGLSPEETAVADVMTPNPDSVGPDLTVLDALHQMHECRYLHLPVVDDRGRVQGLVDVMEIINAMIGEEGSSGWEAFFGDAMDAGDDFSDTGSMRSLGSIQGKKKAPSMMSRRSAAAKSTTAAKKKDVRPVSQLRPKMPVLQQCTASILEVALAMAAIRTDAALILGSDGSLAGIVTDNDLTRRVVAKHVDVDDEVMTVMTSNPKCVSMDDSAMEALGVMVERHFRHLPVVDKKGNVAGLLDIAKCLYEAISRMEKVAARKDGGNDKGAAAALTQMTKAMSAGNKGSGVNAAQAAAMMQLMAQAFGGDGGVKTLGDVLMDAGEALFVSPMDSVREASEAMASGRKAVLVVERGSLVGIFTPKDVLSRVLAKGLSPDETAVGAVMTPNPDSVAPDLTVLDALHQMHECRYLHLPVVDDRGRVQGLVDVMEIINAMIGEEGSSAWESFFGDALEAADDISDIASERSGFSMRSRGGPIVRGVPAAGPPLVARVNVGQNQHGNDAPDGEGSDMMSLRADRLDSHDFQFDYKLTDLSGNLHRLSCSAEVLADLVTSVRQVLGENVASGELVIKYCDDDGDEITLTTDESLQLAVDHARAHGLSSLKISAAVTPSSITQQPAVAAEAPASAGQITAKTASSGRGMMYLGAGVAAAAVAGLALVLMKGKSK